ncbi:hypothetical protein RUND412_007278 [Rhizina undulata]
MTPAANNMLNPWRIKVVVEAERHDSGPVGSASRSRSTKTIMVPLGGLEFEADTIWSGGGEGREDYRGQETSMNALGARTITRTRTTKVPVKGLDSSPAMPLPEPEEDELTQAGRGRSVTRRKPTPKKTPGAKVARNRKKVDTVELKLVARTLGRRQSIVRDGEDRTEGDGENRMEGDEEEGIMPQEQQEEDARQTPRLILSTRSSKPPAATTLASTRTRRPPTPKIDPLTLPPETLLPSPRAPLSPKTLNSMPSASPNSTDSEEELQEFTFISGSPEKSYVPQRRKKTSPKANVPPREDSSHSEPPLAESFCIVSGDSDDSFETQFLLPPELSGMQLSVDPQEDKPEKDAPQSPPPLDYSPSPGLSQNEGFHSHSEDPPSPPPSDDDFALLSPPPLPITIVSSASESSLSLSRFPAPAPGPKWRTDHWRQLDCILRSSKTLPAQPPVQYYLPIEDLGAIKDVIGRLRIGGDGALVSGTRESAGVGKFLREGGWEEGWTVADVARKVGAWVIAGERRRMREEGM